MNQHHIRSLMLFALTGLWSASAQAEWVGNINFTSNYVYNGVTQTKDKAAAQAGLDYYHAMGFYAGAWASNVHFRGSPARVEADFYLGWAGGISDKADIDFNMAYFRYFGDSVLSYPQANLRFNYNWSEHFSSWLLIEYSPRYFGVREEDYGHARLGFTGTLPGTWSWTAEIGYSETDNPGLLVIDYNEDHVTDWRLAIGREWLGWNGELFYTDTDVGEDNPDADAVVGVSVGRTL